MAVDRHQNDDLRPYLYKTADYGKSWTPIVAGIPNNTFARVIREDPKRRGLLFAGTETGIYYSVNDGAAWLPLKLNLPTTPVHDLTIKNDDLVVATHGRAFWILDDITPLRQFQKEFLAEDLHLYRPQTAIRMYGPAEAAKSPLAGQNPPTGAIIDYWLKQKPKGEVKIEVLDDQGRLLRSYSSKKLKENEQPPDPDDEKPKPEIEPAAGLNRFVWDLRTQSVHTLDNYYLYELRAGARGPLVLPGSYQVRVTADGKTAQQPFHVVLDPRVTAAPADLQKQFDFVTRVQQRLDRVYRSVNQMLLLRAEIREMAQRRPEASADMLRAGQALDRKVAAIQDALVDLRIQSNEESLAYPLGLDGKLAALAAAAGGDADAAPTQAMYQVFDRFDEQLTAQLNRWTELVKTEAVALEKEIAGQKIGTVSVP